MTALAPPIRGFPAELYTLPVDGLPGLLRQSSATLSLEADLELGSGAGNGSVERVRYRVSVEIDPDPGSLAVADEYLTRLSAAWEPRDTARIERAGKQLVLRRLRGRPAHEPLRANHTKLSDAHLSGAPWRLFDLTREELRLWRTYYLDPASAMRAATPPREVADIGVRGEHIAPFLYGLKSRRPKLFQAVRRALRSVIPAVGSLDVDLDAKRGTLDIQIEQDGTVFSSRIVSEGTLRVLALCAIAVTALQRRPRRPLHRDRAAPGFRPLGVGGDPLDAEESVETSIRVGSARAGLPRLARELRAFGEAIRRQAGTPDVLVVLADANAAGPAGRREEIERVGLDAVVPAVAIGTPDPCVEAWFLADPQAIASLFEVPAPDPPGADADSIKHRLVEALSTAGEVVTQGGAEFADEIVAAIDLYRAGQAAPTLKRFIAELRAALRTTGPGRAGAR
jgi:hypothetical protein